MAVDNLTLAVPDGSIFAFLGPNGAGKTTTIKLLLNLITPDGGTSEIFGVESGKLGPKEFNQIGYVSENQKIYDWMTVKQLIAFCKPLYPAWDDAFCGRLVKQFDLTLDRTISGFSRGMKIKTAFLVSLAQSGLCPPRHYACAPQAAWQPKFLMLPFNLSAVW